MKRFLSLIALLAVLVLPVSVSAQTALTETTLAAAVTSSATSVVLTSATGVSAGVGIYVDREYMTVGASYVSGTTVPVLRRAGARAHATSTLTYIGPATAFITVDRSGACTSTNETYLPQINTVNGSIWDCGAKVGRWVNLRALQTVTCRALLVADQIDQSCFTADRPYVVYKINYVATTAEAGGTLTIIPRKQSSTQTPASGTALATAINAVTTGTAAQTVATATLSSTATALLLATGDRLGLDYTDDTAGELAGVVVTFFLYPL